MAGVGVLRTVEGGRLSFWCEGCAHYHCVTTGPGGWGWNGDYDRPTFTPSILVTYDYWEPPVTFENHEEWKLRPWEQHKVQRVCHSFVTSGRIRYLDDCTHKLKGQEVQLQREDDVENEQLKETVEQSQPEQEKKPDPVAEEAEAEAGAQAQPQAEGAEKNPAEKIAEASEKATELAQPSAQIAQPGAPLEQPVPDATSTAARDGDSQGAADPVPEEPLRAPLFGTAPGDILDRVRELINQFEHAVATEAHEDATYFHKKLADEWGELRGHFQWRE